MHYTQKTKFSLHKSLICPECAQLSLVSCSVHETCEDRFLQHYSVAFSSPCIPVWRTRSTKNRIFGSQLYQKLRIIYKKGRFHDERVQLFQNVYRFTSCAIGQVILHASVSCSYSKKARNMVKSTVSV